MQRKETTLDSYLESLIKKDDEPVVDEVAKEEVVKEVVPSVSDQDIEPISESEPEPVVEVKKEEPKKSASNELAKGTALPVKNIRIYNRPDSKSLFKVFSGNIIMKNKVDDMIEIEYVKPGYGLVKGFTPDLG